MYLQEVCRTKFGFLAEVEDADENRFLKSNAVFDSYWIGGTDKQTEGVFMWVHSGVKFDFNDWDNGEPNDAEGNEDCVQLKKEFDYKWNDSICAMNYHFVCEIPWY
ncbi:hypothetical protein KUTeg_017644 [Tegillarca granosa]|uniref:C-type lectin domain-containing protein n=1 Tax=Tegillarca granosa TaxID=220873 RepID=A0ABQ9EJJ8_TEGGR|nr:hypothetical protein KUTeg_017644 [Tegillarca granosa]